MDIQRIRTEAAQAMQRFAYVEVHPTNDGGLFVKAAFQTSVGNTYIASVFLQNYPNQMPKVHIVRPALQGGTGHRSHRYDEGNICYLHPNMWNPGRHNLEFVLGRTAKWLNKYEVWRVRGVWPGAEITS